MPLKFGVEIEFLVPGAHPHEDYRRAGFRLGPPIAADLDNNLSSFGSGCYYAGYTHQVSLDKWKVVTDASLQPPASYAGLELVSPPLREETGLEQISKACSLLAQQHQAMVNRSCGLHVHIATQDMTLPALRKLAWLYVENEDVIDNLLPPSRRGNNNPYCVSLKGTANLKALAEANTVPAIALAIKKENPWSSRPNPGRHVKLNFTSYWKYGTVEFRHHSGTIDPVKINRWVLFCAKMVDTARRQADEPIVVPHDPTALPRARQLRIIYNMVARAEGATRTEVQAALNRATPPSLPTDLKRIGVDFVINGRRSGQRVYCLRVQTPQTPTLLALMEKMQLTAEDQQFWQAREALLASQSSSSLED